MPIIRQYEGAYLEPKLENVLKNSAIQQLMQNKKEKNGQGNDKGKLQNHS